MSDLSEFRDDGLSLRRREEFDAGRRAVRSWEIEHPMTFEDYLRFLESFQDVFGPLTPRFDGAPVGEFRL
jgi:hypothetical protein